MTYGQGLLVLVLAAPAVGALVAALVPARYDLTGRVLAGLAAAAALAGCVFLPLDRLPEEGGAIQPWQELDVAWAPGLDLRFHIGVDGISYPLVVLTALLTLLCCAYTCWRVPSVDGRRPERGRLLASMLLVIEVGILGVFLALDLVLFFVFFEVVLLPMYAVILLWGGPDRRHAARKFVLYTLLGSLLLLVGVFTVVANAGTADLIALTTAPTLSHSVQVAAFALLALAFAVKSPLWPLHTWLPDAHTEAPTVGSVILAGVLLKMGTYGLLRVAVGVAPEGAEVFAPTLGILAVAAILIGGLVCLAMSELKRLIAYSSVGHMGFVLLGIATLTATGFRASLIGNIAHGIITGLLFFLAGAVKDRAHTGSLTELGGLRETAPALSGILAYAAIASLGLPGLAGFWGEAFAVVAAFQRDEPLWTALGVLAAIGGAIAAAYFLRLLRRVTHGPASPPVLALASGGGRLDRVELAAWGPLILLALVVGLVPGLVVTVGGSAVDSLLAAVTR